MPGVTVFKMRQACVSALKKSMEGHPGPPWFNQSLDISKERNKAGKKTFFSIF
jgi:hypothetical protein